jgi:hypothetical protein
MVLLNKCIRAVVPLVRPLRGLSLEGWNPLEPLLGIDANLALFTMALTRKVVPKGSPLPGWLISHPSQCFGRQLPNTRRRGFARPGRRTPTAGVVRADSPPQEPAGLQEVQVEVGVVNLSAGRGQLLAPLLTARCARTIKEDRFRPSKTNEASLYVTP